MQKIKVALEAGNEIIRVGEKVKVQRVFGTNTEPIVGIFAGIGMNKQDGFAAVHINTDTPPFRVDIPGADIERIERITNDKEQDQSITPRIKPGACKSPD